MFLELGARTEEVMLVRKTEDPEDGRALIRRRDRGPQRGGAVARWRGTIGGTRHQKTDGRRVESPMYRTLKTHPRPPVDVTHLRRLTSEEQRAQSCDVRSRIAELSADPDRPIAVTEDHPHLGGRRMFLHAFNALFEHVPRVRASRLQKPNTKALHLHSAAYQWCRAEILYRRLWRHRQGTW